MSDISTHIENEICQESMYFSAIEHKKMEWGSALNALMIHSGKTRSQMALCSGISKGRITRILSGEANLTLETVCNFAHALGYDVDIAFYSTADTKPYQPWNVGQQHFATLRRFKAIMQNFEQNFTTTTLSGHDLDSLEPLQYLTSAFNHSSYEFLSKTSIQGRLENFQSVSLPR